MERSAVAIIYTLKKALLQKFLDYYHDFSLEHGCALGVQDNSIVDFVPLNNCSKNKKEFVPSFAELNKALKHFLKNQYNFGGIMHSHNVGMFKTGTNKPTKEDLSFFASFLEANDGFKRLLFPIITKEYNNKIISWNVFENGKCFEVKVKVV